ncbi:MAG: hypothetical protein IKW97_07050 [Muribaculaceae bacterium]|nr:hypothetical protein [Muribaculaceae bacterium]
MRKLVLMSLALLATIGVAAQTNRIFIEDFEIEPGTTDSVAVMFSSVDPSRGLQFNISLPKGLAYMGADVTEYAANYNMSVSCNYSEKYRCYSAFIYPPGRICFPADTTAAVMNLWLKAKDEFKGGTIIIWKCRGSTIDNNTIYMDGDTTTVTVPQASIIGIPVDNQPVKDQYFNLLGQPITSPGVVPVAIQVTTLANGGHTSRKVAVVH